MSTFERLREERERLGLSQEKFGALGGVLKRAQINYEKGERNPDSAYLTAIAAAGVDVLYVLTGQRGAQSAPGPGLRDGEAELLEGYRALSAREKLGVKALIAGMAPGGVSVRVSGNGSHVVTGSGDVVIGHPAPTPVQRRVRAAAK